MCPIAVFVFTKQNKEVSADITSCKVFIGFANHHLFLQEQNKACLYPMQGIANKYIAPNPLQLYIGFGNVKNWHQTYFLSDH